MTRVRIKVRWLLAALLCSTLWFAPGPGHGQSRELVDAYFQADELYDRGHFDEALPFAKKAVEIGGEEFSANHPTFATQLNRLAMVYDKLGRHVEAESLYKRALAIRERVLGLDAPDVGKTLANLARLYLDEGRLAEAEPLYERSLAISQIWGGPDTPGNSTALSNLAALFDAQGRRVAS